MGRICSENCWRCWLFFSLSGVAFIRASARPRRVPPESGYLGRCLLGSALLSSRRRGVRCVSLPREGAPRTTNQTESLKRSTPSYRRPGGCTVGSTLFRGVLCQRLDPELAGTGTPFQCWDTRRTALRVVSADTGLTLDLEACRVQAHAPTVDRS